MMDMLVALLLPLITMFPAMSPFLFQNRRSLLVFTCVVGLALLLLQDDAIYGAVVGYQQSTELLYVLLPHALFTFLGVAAIRFALLNWRPEPFIWWKTAILAVLSLYVAFYLANDPLVPLLGGLLP